MSDPLRCVLAALVENADRGQSLINDHAMDRSELAERMEALHYERKANLETARSLLAESDGVQKTA